uniref:Uncharacterized protein n=1 Tax=Onchocerca volvulus TaxID=6282 RepID=A0A8R1XQ21_ONCVO
MRVFEYNVVSKFQTNSQYIRKDDLIQVIQKLTLQIEDLSFGKIIF